MKIEIDTIEKVIKVKRLTNVLDFIAFLENAFTEEELKKYSIGPDYITGGIITTPQPITVPWPCPTITPYVPYKFPWEDWKIYCGTSTTVGNYTVGRNDVTQTLADGKAGN